MWAEKSITNLPDDFSAVVPPDPIPNSVVKRRSTDGSVEDFHAKVANGRASNLHLADKSVEGERMYHWNQLVTAVIATVRARNC